MASEQEDIMDPAAGNVPPNGDGPVNGDQHVETAVGVDNDVAADEENNAQDVHNVQQQGDDGATAPTSSRRSVRFAPPQDIVSEKVTFDASDGTAPVSVEGIVEYAPSLGAKTASISSNSSYSSWDPQRRRASRQGSEGSRRQSSLELRKNLPESILLKEQSTAILDDAATAPQKRRRSSRFGADGCFRRLFLNPSYSLRKQMLLTFGTVSLLTILMVMLVSIVATISTGEAVKDQSSENIEQWVNDFVSTTSRYVAKALSPKIMPNDLVDLLAEIACDRFAGYPSGEDLTPFFDTETGANAYPLQNDPLPMDWDFSHTPNNSGNVNADNYAEHVQDRLRWYSTNPRLSTAVASYHMQGACDPSSTNPSDMVYYPNCTDANNDVVTGGIVAPNPTNERVYRKAADMSPFLKALYEYHQDIMSVGYYFGNSGAGGSVIFPHYEFDASGSYVSIGCDWMRAPNPINATLGPIGTEEEIARCHPAGAIVPTREYNPLERGWCRDQALDAQRIQNSGPYLNAWTSENMWLMSTGRAVYDLATGAFVNCISADFTIDGVNDILDEVKVDDLGILTLVRNDDDGTVVTSPKFDFDAAESTTTVTDPSLETGVDQDLFDAIKSVVDYSQPWDPDEASKAYEAVFHPDDRHIVAAYPIPSIPTEYDPLYAPMFFAIFTLPLAKGLAPIIESVSQDVDDSVASIVLFTVIIGVVGIVVVFMTIFATSSWFVRPLKWMQHVGDQVVGKFGQELDTGIEYERKKSKSCLPQTELNKLAEEFSKMVARFSGEGTARRTQAVDTEKMNVFDYSSEFAGLYLSRDDSSFAFQYLKTLAVSATEGETPKQCNLGPNTRSLSKSETTSSVSEANEYDGTVHKSPLFLWMVALIVIPTLVFTVVNSTVVLWQISHQLPSLIEPVEGEYLALMDSYRFSAAGMLAIRTAEVTERAARDNYLITRLASWLFFGGMNVSQSFTAIDERAEECKTAPSESNCQWENQPCDCAWKDFAVVRGDAACTEFPPGESRFLQRAHFAGMSEDADPDGSRSSITYPFARFPNETSWWDNTTVLPTEGSANTAYGTTSDRVKILAALSTAFVPIYNYDNTADKHMGMYVGFEADGMLGGFRGCRPSYTSYPFWSSTADNGAALIRPELCPIGKFGYDARCRGWYDEGKKKAQTGKGTLHITAPYAFADSSVIGQTITSPLIDPRGQVHIGQTIVDFLPDSIFRALQGHSTQFTEGEFTILITPESDVLGHDTVISPGFSLDSEGEAIEDLLLPDADGQRILQDMKEGNRGYGRYKTADSPNGEETMHIAYAPVIVRNYSPLNSSDMARGVQTGTTLVYSLALAESEADTMKPFLEVNDFTSTTVNICIGVLATLIVLSTVLMGYIAFRVAKALIIPLLKLFEVLRDINSMQTSDDDITKLSSYKGSCLEVDSVYKTLEMLYKVVRFANAAFFSGDLEMAYNVLRDALRLFTRLGNKKAEAVASNNLGNTLLTIYRTMKAGDSEEMCGLTKPEVIEKGTAYFAYSIKLGEEAYDQFMDEVGWSEECLSFMQFLANRYFNRAMFFLTTSCDSPNKQDAESLGFRDLEIAGDMDVEIVDQCIEMGFKINRVERYELMMSRVRGLLALVEIGFDPEELHVEDQIADVYRDLTKALQNTSHALFKEMGAAGRMQKLDVELIKYHNLAMNNHVNAARVAIRMLVEDEYIFPDAEHEATKMLLAYLKSGRDANCPKDDDGHIAKDLSLVVFALEHEYLRQSRTQSMLNNSSGPSMRALKLDLSDSDRYGKDESEKSIRDVARRSSAVKESCRFDVTMELF